MGTRVAWRRRACNARMLVQALLARSDGILVQAFRPYYWQLSTISVRIVANSTIVYPNSYCHSKQSLVEASVRTCTIYIGVDRSTHHPLHDITRNHLEHLWGWGWWWAWALACGEGAESLTVSSMHAHVHVPSAHLHVLKAHHAGTP